MHTDSVPYSLNGPSVPKELAENGCFESKNQAQIALLERKSGAQISLLFSVLLLCLYRLFYPSVSLLKKAKTGSIPRMPV